MASGSERQLSFAVMSGDYRNQPVAPSMQIVSMSSDNFGGTPVFVQGRNFSGSRVRSRGKYIRDDVTPSISGDFVSLFSGPESPLIRGGMWAEPWRNTHDAGYDGLSLEGAVFTASGSTLDLTLATNLANFTITDYDRYRIRGTANGNNDNVYRLVETGTDTNIYTVTPAITADEIAGTSVLIDGRTAHNGAERMYTYWERAHTDNNTYFFYPGLVNNVFNIDLTKDGVAGLTMSFVGLRELDTSGTGTPGATYVDAAPDITYSTNNDLKVYYDGNLVDSCLFDSASIDINNTAVGRTGLGQNGYCEINSSDGLTVTVNLTMAFNDDSIRTKMKNGISFSLGFELIGSDKSIIRIDMEDLLINQNDIPVDGPGDILQNAVAVASNKGLSKRAIQISEFPAY